MMLLRKIYATFQFFWFYLFKLVQANVIIAIDIITPKMHTSPGTVNLPLRTNTDLGLLLVSNLISMTPGTLSIDITENNNSLLVHYLYGSSPEKVIEELEIIQSKVIELTNKK